MISEMRVRRGNLVAHTDGKLTPRRMPPVRLLPQRRVSFFQTAITWYEGELVFAT